MLLMNGERQSVANAAADDAAPTDLAAAIELFKEQLREDGKEEFVALISEERVRDSIRTAIRSYETLLNAREEERNAGDAEYFNNVVKPVYMEIAETGAWSEDCRLTRFYSLTDSRGITYSGIAMRLQIETLGEQFQGFAIPILDVYYGRFSGN